MLLFASGSLLQDVQAIAHPIASFQNILETWVSYTSAAQTGEQDGIYHVVEQFRNLQPMS